MMQSLDDFFGDEWQNQLHGALASALQVFIVKHSLGIALDSFVHRRKTWLAIVTGRRTPFQLSNVIVKKHS